MKTGNFYSSSSYPAYTIQRSPSKSGLNIGSSISDRDSVTGRNKKNRIRKLSNGSIKSPKIMSKKKIPDFTDYAYREAVTRLKYLLAESYAPSKSALPYHKNIRDESGDDTDNQSIIDRPALSDISKYLSTSYKGSRTNLNNIKPYTSLIKDNLSTSAYSTTSDFLTRPPDTTNQPAPPEILNFIEKQEDYIEQLEKESQFCRSELSNLLDKVRVVVNENDTLTEHARSDLVNLCDKPSASSESEDLTYEKYERRREKPKQQHLSGPSIIFESKITELEAELAQANIDIRKLRNENDELKRRIAHGTSADANADIYRKQVDNLQREKINLEDTVRKLHNTIDTLKSEGSQITSKHLRNRDIADMAVFERSQAEMEIKHLRDELERQHERIRDLQHEMAKRVAEERANAERRYNYQVDQLGGDLSSQWEQAAKLQLELERQKRLESDLKRDLTQRNAQIEELKNELKLKRSSFLSDVAQINAEKQSLEQEITSLRLQLERAERQSKIETARLNAEINSLRQRLDRADADVLHARRENLRLNDDIANLEKEVALGDMKSEIRPTRSDLNKTITDMEHKHETTVKELEEMIHSQKQLMDKLTVECKALTNKLEDTSIKHKMEITALQSNVEFLTNKFIDNDKINTNDNYSNIQTSKAPAEYESPSHALNRTASIESRQDFSPVSKDIPNEYKQSVENSNINVDNTGADGSNTNTYGGYDYGDDENSKERTADGDKYRRNGDFATNPQLFGDDKKTYESGSYEPRDGDQQFTEPTDPEYTSKYPDDYNKSYQQLPYDSNEYQTDYVQPYNPQQEFQGDQQQYEYQQPEYPETYQPDTTPYPEQGNIPIEQPSGEIRPTATTAPISAVPMGPNGSAGSISQPTNRSPTEGIQQPRTGNGNMGLSSPGN